MTKIPTFDHPITISETDIDHMGHVNNTVYLQWVQDAVVQYWLQVSPPGVQDGILWVALQHQITYRMPLFLGDTVAALVTATGTRGSRASFTTVIKRGGDVAAEIQSSWCCVDASTRRPRRIADEIARIFLPPSQQQGGEARPASGSR
jgi:acyl-CoA thioester hydrolase